MERDGEVGERATVGGTEAEERVRRTGRTKEEVRRKAGGKDEAEEESVEERGWERRKKKGTHASTTSTRTDASREEASVGVKGIL